MRPAGRTYLEVEVLYTPGKGKCRPNGNAVMGDGESGASRRRSAGPTNRKRIEAGACAAVRQPARSFYATELIRLVGAGSGAVQRELARLEQSGLVTVPRMGTQNTSRPIPARHCSSEICGIVQKTVGLAEPLRAGPARLKDAETEEGRDHCDPTAGAAQWVRLGDPIGCRAPKRGPQVATAVKVGRGGNRVVSMIRLREPGSRRGGARVRPGREGGPRATPTEGWVDLRQILFRGVGAKSPLTFGRAPRAAAAECRGGP